jgi:hypothetical protein
MKAVEFFYTVQETSLLLRLCDKTIVAKLKAGEFGADVVNLGSELRADYRIPASGINDYLAAKRVLATPGIAARTTGELRRKAAAVFSRMEPVVS